MIPELLPGDALLYRPNSLTGWIIAIKSWTKVSHIEVYAGQGFSVASRDGIGVNKYPLRMNGLGYILRPVSPVDVPASMAWFWTVAGQRYDWLGLLCFTLAVHQGARDRMFCSEFATRWYRKGGFKPVSDEVDADHVAPSEFLQSPAFTAIWSDGNSSD